MRHGVGKRIARGTATAVLALCVVSCAPGELIGDSVADGRGKADSSAEAAILNFELDGELLASSDYGPEERIQEQLFYTVGPLNQESAVGRLDKIVTSNIKTEKVGEQTRISYHAVLPVAWGKRDRIPSEWTFVLPRDVSWGGLAAFFEKYKDSCSSAGAHDMEASVYWYDYRSDRASCKPEAGDVVRVTARVRPSPVETTGRFPEYHKVWEDKALRVVSIYGLDKPENAGSESDLGVRSYRLFIDQMLEVLRPYSPTTEPKQIPATLADTPFVTIRASLPEGRSVEVTAMLVSRMTSTSQTFDGKYNELSASADLIAYNGHSGVGANIRALARKGRWVAGQYVIVFMNGCDTYAYQDSALADAHKAINPDETTGTRYVDLVLNAMPAGWNFWRDDATTVLMKGLLRYQEPRTFERMFLEVPTDQVVLVAGEEDNVYVPGYPDDTSPVASDWEGLEDCTVLGRGEEQHFSTPKLPPGRYEITLSGDGNVDLHLRVGTPASTQVWDCRPARNDSVEVCRVDLPSAAPLHLMLRGQAESSSVELSAHKL